jgi:hypothetical protein
MPAVQLRALSGVYRRQRDGGNADGLQRLHDPVRSKTIRDFGRFGHPYSGLKGPMRNELTAELKKPGWLPTAIVVNILGPTDERRGRQVASTDLVTVEADGLGNVVLRLPYENSSEHWAPLGLEPFEVIDGQHRLWAFDEEAEDGLLPGDFELPVVAFRGLDIGWQAYLFWSINVSPKKINPSHAFDLFPLLRSEAWLETFSELKFYREARAQELTELLFRHPDSPWHNRINMLGESARTAPEGAGVTQAGWVRALTSTFLGSGSGNATHGLFGAPINITTGPLDWTRAQQAAFLIVLWRELKAVVTVSTEEWANSLRERDARPDLLSNNIDPVFSGTRTMLNQEQGVRGILSAANDVFFRLARLRPEVLEWNSEAQAGGETALEDVTTAINELENHALLDWIRQFALSTAGYDWRSADALGLTEDQQLLKRAFRGSGGYVALREQLKSHMSQSNDLIAGVLRELSIGDIS